MKNFFAASILTFGLLIPRPAFPAEMEEMITDAYLAMLDADKLIEEKKPVEALKLYQQSLKTYENLKAQDPGYKPENVDYRIAQISEKISILSQELPDSQTREVAETEVSPPEEQDFKALYFQTREKMVKDSGRLLDLEKRNIQMTVALRERQQELEKLKQTVQTQGKKLSMAEEAQTESHAKLEKEIKDLSRFNMLLQDRADKLEITNQQLSKQREDLLNEGEALQTQLTALTEKHLAVENELKESRRMSKLNEQNLILTRNQLQDDLAAREMDLKTAKAQAAELQAKLKDVSLLEETVIELNRQNEFQLAQISELKTELETVRSTGNDKLAELADTEEALTQSKARVEELQTEKAAWEESQKARAALQAEWEDKLSAAGQRVADLQKDVEEAVKEKELAEQERAEVLSKRGEYRDEMKAVANENKELQKEMDRLKKESRSWQSDKSRLEEALAKMRLENEAKAQESKTLQQSYRDDLDELKDLRKNAEKWEELRADLQKKVENKTADMEILAQEISKLRTDRSKETVARGQIELQNKDLQSQLTASEAEKKRLAINLQQETDQRKLLEKNAEQQLKTITDRMNEIISLRQEISKLESKINGAE